MLRSLTVHTRTRVAGRMECRRALRAIEAQALAGLDRGARTLLLGGVSRADVEAADPLATTSGAGGRARTDTSSRTGILSAVRLPLPPRPHGALIIAFHDTCQQKLSCAPSSLASCREACSWASSAAR